MQHYCEIPTPKGTLRGFFHKPNQDKHPVCLIFHGFIDNAATEQLFGHVKDEFYRGREWGSFEDFKRDLEGYIVHWNTRRRQVRLKGLTPEEFRSRALAA